MLFFYTSSSINFLPHFSTAKIIPNGQEGANCCFSPSFHPLPALAISLAAFLGIEGRDFIFNLLRLALSEPEILRKCKNDHKVSV
jgi:hypothetical protein